MSKDDKLPFDLKEEEEAITTYKSNKDLNQFKQALYDTYRNMNFSDLQRYIKKLAINNINKTSTLIIETCIELSEIRVKSILEAIQESIDDIEQKLPGNHMMLKDVLWQLSNGIEKSIDSLNENLMWGNLQKAAFLIDKSSPATYNYRDIQCAEEKGYQKGYQTCLNVTKTSRTTSRRLNLIE